MDVPFGSQGEDEVWGGRQWSPEWGKENRWWCPTEPHIKWEKAHSGTQPGWAHTWQRVLPAQASLNTCKMRETVPSPCEKGKAATTHHPHVIQSKTKQITVYNLSKTYSQSSNWPACGEHNSACPTGLTCCLFFPSTPSSGGRNGSGRLHLPLLLLGSGRLGFPSLSLPVCPCSQLFCRGKWSKLLESPLWRKVGYK